MRVHLNLSTTIVISCRVAFSVQVKHHQVTGHRHSNGPSQVLKVPHIPHFEPSLDALSLRCNVMSSIKIHSFLVQVAADATPEDVKKAYRKYAPFKSPEAL